jgi:hypothetical protein
MHVSRQKEQFSLAYVHAVASVAGFNVGDFAVDDDSVDIVLKAPGLVGTVRRLNINLQVKCTERLTGDEDHWTFRLKRKNYVDLTDPDVHLPSLLVVLNVPPNLDDWLVWGDDEMTLRRRAYWLSLKGQAPLAPDQQSATVYVPRKNVFDVDGLHEVAKSIAEGLL